jgi:3,4-dihydroxy 2-butanone 4-phosphate synthase/GTP cyclohydrolase II
MDLRSYLAEHRLTHEAFARQIGVTTSAVTKLVAGTRPSWPTMERIVAATSGAVTPNDFLPPTATTPAQADQVAA